MTLRSGPLERPERYMADTTKAAKLDAFENISKKETLGEWVRKWRRKLLKLKHPICSCLDEYNFFPQCKQDNDSFAELGGVAGW